MRAQVKQKIKTLPEKVYINPGSVEYEQMLHDFQRDIAQCDNDYIHESYLKRKDNKSYNYDYYEHMLKVCTQYFDRGLSFSNITKTATIGCVMMAISPNFRQHVTKAFTRNVLPHAKALLKDNVKSEEFLSRLENLASGGKFDDKLWTPKTAALQHISLSKKAYDDMRLPGADVSAIQSKFDNDVVELKHMFTNQGISVEEVYRNEGIIVGMSQDFESDKIHPISTMFSGLAFGMVKPSEPVSVDYPRFTENGCVYDSVKEWDGSYNWDKSFIIGESEQGEPIYDNVNIFEPRQPIPVDEYESLIGVRLLNIRRHYEGVEGDLQVSEFMKHVAVCMQDDHISEEDVKSTFMTFCPDVVGEPEQSSDEFYNRDGDGAEVDPDVVMDRLIQIATQSLYAQFGDLYQKDEVEQESEYC